MTSISNSLKYPKKSHRKKVFLPKHSSQLAEFFGVMIGDGGINNSWQANISLNSIKDKKYAAFVAGLCVKNFGVVPALRKRKTRNTLVVSLASTSVVEFLISEGLPKGNKLKNDLHIPDWILNNQLYSRSCVRGLMDTDGCLFIHKHKVFGKLYQNIGLCFTSFSKELIFQVAEIFEKNQILGHITNEGKRIYLYKAEAVGRYLKIFGTSNSRIDLVYKKWRDARVV